VGVKVRLHRGEGLSTEAQWSQLSDVEFLVNGSRCTIYTAVYGGAQCVVKTPRKDVPDAALVRRELELEMELLMRCVGVGVGACVRVRQSVCVCVSACGAR
jgi:hypothetical protein